MPRPNPRIIAWLPRSAAPFFAGSCSDFLRVRDRLALFLRAGGSRSVLTGFPGRATPGLFRSIVFDFASASLTDRV